MNMRNPHIIWASVAIVFMLIAGSVTLTALGKDTTVILTLAAAVAVPVLGAFGAAIYQKVDQVKEISNGNTKRHEERAAALQAELKLAHDKIVEMALHSQPPPLPGPDGVTTVTTTTKTDPA
jgi:hypothetical protein